MKKMRTYFSIFLGDIWGPQGAVGFWLVPDFRPRLARRALGSVDFDQTLNMAHFTKRKHPEVWILTKNNRAQQVQFGKSRLRDGHLFGALGGERAQIFPHVERMSYFYPMCCDCLRPPAMLWGCLRLSVIVCHRLPLVLCNSSCPQMGKGKRPACLHQPNLYLEPKWLR